jgi:hypothetical protein
MEGKSDAEAFEEMGVDTDESVGANMKVRCAPWALWQAP